MKPLKSSAISTEEFIQILRLQLRVLASRSKKIHTITSYLEQKGIPPHEAYATAIEIWHETRRSRFLHHLPRQLIGWSLLLFGMGFTALSLFSGGSLMVIFFIIATGRAFLGAAVSWGNYSSDRSE